MKCLFINPDYPPPMVGGSVVHYYSLHSSFDVNELVVLTSQAPGSKEFDARLPYRVIRKSYIKRTACEEPHFFKALNLVRQFITAWRLIVEEDFGVIHVGQFYPGAFMGWLLRLATGRPYVLTVMGEDLTGLKITGRARRGLVLWSMRRAARVCTISSFAQKRLIEHGADPDKTTVLAPGIDLSKCDAAHTREPEFWAGIKGTTVLLTVGRLTERKGHDMVLRALPAIIKERPDVHYVIAGKGLEEGTLKSLTIKMGLTDHVTFVPNATDQEIAFLYKNCRLFIMPNRELPNGDTEGFGIVFLEAGWWGKPVIGGNAGGVPDAITDGVTGLLVDGRDEHAIAQAILKLLREPEYAAKLGQAGRQRALSENWVAKSKVLKNILTDSADRQRISA